ncbi:ras-like GTP-binding protein RYL1 [Acropora millepora]|nr:ras-like GTP-binding protein RYL1 [Acropora millepora]
MAEGRPKGRTNWVDYCFKVIIIGDYKVGKTTLLCKYTGRELPSINNSVSVDFRVKTLHRGDKKVKLQIWDIAGQERFRTAVSSYYRGASGVVLVYDVTNRTSFQNIGYWYEEMKRLCESTTKGILVGNRCHFSDQRQVSTEEGQTFAEHLEMPFFETSTEKDININECFDKLVDSVLESVERSKQLNEFTSLILPASGQELRQVEACTCVLL